MGWFGRDRQRQRAESEQAREAAFMRDVFVHWEAAHRFALRLSGNEAEAADVVQEALTKAFESFDRTREDTRWRPWLFTIVRNTFISRVRKGARESLLEDAPQNVREPRAEPDGAEVAPIDWRSLRGAGDAFEDEILAALLALPEAQRCAVILCDIEGLDYDTIAEVVDCPVGTVRSRIHHARRRLREALAAYANERGYRHVEQA